jgi:hypothetical protein
VEDSLLGRMDFCISALFVVRMHNKFLDALGEMVGRDKARGRSRHLC